MESSQEEKPFFHIPDVIKEKGPKYSIKIISVLMFFFFLDYIIDCLNSNAMFSISQIIVWGIFATLTLGGSIYLWKEKSMGWYFSFVFLIYKFIESISMIMLSLKVYNGYYKEFELNTYINMMPSIHFFIIMISLFSIITLLNAKIKTWLNVDNKWLLICLLLTVSYSLIMNISMYMNMQ